MRKWRSSYDITLPKSGFAKRTKIECSDRVLISAREKVLKEIIKYGTLKVLKDSYNISIKRGTLIFKEKRV